MALVRSAEEKASITDSRGSHAKPLRIADVLKESENCDLDRSMANDHALVYCSSPRRIMTRWISGLKKKKPKTDSAETTKGGDGGHRERTGDCHAPELGNAAIVKSGSVRKSQSFTLGVGCCLLYLVAAGRSELSKIVEMKVQMAELLRNVKEDLQARNASCCEENPELPSPSTSSGPLINNEQNSRKDIEELEGELECELARMNIRLEEGNYSAAKLRGRDEERGSSKSGNCWENGVGIECNEESGGVCPYELERKLQNILKERQEEHIRELEAELHCLKKKLAEKEMEISLWKDTAKMISDGTPQSLMLLDSPSNLTPCISFNLR